MKVDVYIHGVPKGQCIWKTDACDDQVITLFYGAGAEEQTKYLVEVRKSGNDSYCYYSMLKYRNVSAQGGRQGSYFGITIRMDMVCTKVQTLFHILDLVYNSDVLDSIIKTDGDRLQFLITDFKEVETNCKRIVDKIMAILGQSVEGKDFIAIVPSMLSGKGCSKLNLAEFSSESTLTCISQGGSVAVSTDYPSSQLTAYIKKKDDEVANLRVQSQQQIETIQSDEAKVRQKLESHYQSEIQEIQNQRKSELESIKTKYANVDVQIKNYKKEIEEKNRTIAKLHQKLNPSVDFYDTNYVPHNKTSLVKVFSTRILPFVNLLVAVALFGFVLWKMPSDNTQTVEQMSSELSEIKDKLAPDTTSVPAPKHIVPSYSLDAVPQHSVKEEDVSKTDKNNTNSIEQQRPSRTTNINKTNPPK